MADIDKKFQKLIDNYEEHCRRIAKASVVDIHERPADKIARVKRIEKDYVTWFEYYFPNYAKVPCAWFHRQGAQEIIDNDVIMALWEIYRSGAKSVHVDMGIPLYLMYTGRLRYMLLIGETEDKAHKLLSACQAQLVYNKRLINDYGCRYKQGDWSSGEFLTSDGVRFTALGFGQDPRGVREEEQRPDYIAVDDVDTRRHVNNDRLMREAVEWIFEDLMGCFDEADGSTRRFVYANNNFHKNSITNRLKKQFKVLAEKSRQEGEKPIHRVLTVPAVKDLTTFEPNWPEKTSAEHWRKKYRSIPSRSFMREYMHVHVEDGKVFKAEDIQWKKMLPLNEYDALVFYGDLSYKAQACHKGMILVGKKDREFHFIYCFLRQQSRTVLAKWLYDLYETTELHNCRKVRYWIEGLFSMDEFVNDFDAEGDARGYYIPVKADKRRRLTNTTVSKLRSLISSAEMCGSISTSGTAPTSRNSSISTWHSRRAEAQPSTAPMRQKAHSRNSIPYSGRQRGPTASASGHSVNINPIFNDMRKIKYIVLHCSATKEGVPFGIEDIGRWHRQRGFRKVGYHYVILLDGTIRKGRDIAQVGAHVQGSNANSIGICYIGGLDADGKPKDTRTEEQKASLFFLLQQLREQFPDAMICGHRDFSPDLNGDGIIEPWEWMKACPCFDAIDEYQSL